MNFPLKIKSDHTLCDLWEKVEEQLENPNLNASKLEKIATMSRSSLHRKLSSELGMSASAFIRYVRLVKSQEMLLAEPEMNISEIAISVGFNSLSYYSRRFTELYGICPKEYRNIPAQERKCKYYFLDSRNT